MSEQINTLQIEEDGAAELARVLGICNACRYCEGFCPVFPAMTQYRTFDPTNMDYLANLCHNCMACYHACQYKPPHPFAVNAPRALASTRVDSYAAYAWPDKLAGLFKRNGLLVSTAIAAGIALVLGATLLLQDWQVLFSAQTGAGAFYQIIPHAVMVSVAGGTFSAGLFALVVSLTKFCKAIGLGPRELCNPRYIIRSLSQAMTLKHLGGGHGDGCNSADDAFSNQRRLFHHLTMWGFMLCFAATCVATIYEYFLGRMSPFPLLSVPVVLGSSGGLGLLVGCSGLFVTKLKTATAPLHLAGLGMDYAFLNLLFWISVTGFALLWWRDSTAMGILLAIHLGFVLAFFVTLPYSKFVHGAYRWLALVKYTADEANRP